MSITKKAGSSKRKESFRALPFLISRLTLDALPGKVNMANEKRIGKGPCDAITRFEQSILHARFLLRIRSGQVNCNCRAGTAYGWGRRDGRTPTGAASSIRRFHRAAARNWRRW